jgi:type II secretory pathway predicted ATPase ExeA
MYEAFFGLRERPFELAPNPRFLLLTGRHAEALSNLEYGVTGRKGITVLLGEAGTGKTTVIRTALQRWEAAGHLVAYINNPTLTRDEFVECLARAFRLDDEAAGSKTRMLAALTALVMRRHAEGLITGLLIDEAQSLSNELLEEIRLLANIETSDEKVFPVVLAGQPELAERLNAAGLRQLKQRVGLRCVLSPLDVTETAAYVAGRIRIAGGVAGQLFSREAVLAVHEYSHGIPRVINVICDNALLAAFAANRRPISSEMIVDVGRDFDLGVGDDQGPGLSDPAPKSPGILLIDAPRREGSRQTPTAPGSLLETVETPSQSPPPEPELRLFGNFAIKRRFFLFG